MMTALGNDISYEQVFAFPLASYAQAGDLAVAISCSGNSPNVLRACEWAKANGLNVVALTGLAGGKVKDLAHVHANVPSDNYGVVEDLHMSMGHIAAQMLKSRISASL
jgi:D-sedoheptulose 7-phosphate isomerase